VRAFLPEGDDRLWVSSTASDLWLLDLSVPAAPQILMHQWWTGSIRGLARVGDYLYLAAYLSGIYVLDVSDPMSPILVTQVDDVVPNVMAHHGARLYVGDGFADGVTVFSLADPALPVAIGTIDPSRRPRQMIVHQDRLWIHHSSPSGRGLDVYDLLDPDPAPPPALEVAGLGGGGLLPLGDHVAVGDIYIYLLNPPCRELTAVADPGAPPPAGLRLAAAPNPFNPRTTLSLALPEGGPVDLAIHDLRGRRLRTVLREDRPAGQLVVTWDGRDDRGRALPAGVYLARAVMAGTATSVKVALVK